MASVTDRIFLCDMDGVITNWVQGIIWQFQLNCSTEDWATWSHHQEFGISDSELWKATESHNWWFNLQPYDWASKLLTRLRAEGHVIFCTSPSLHDACPSQKVAWLRKHDFMSKGYNDYQIGPMKELNAKSGAILLDDSDSNIDKYRNAGGTAILFPQPWNANKAFTSMRLDYVAREISRL